MGEEIAKGIRGRCTQGTEEGEEGEERNEGEIDSTVDQIASWIGTDALQ